MAQLAIETPAGFRFRSTLLSHGWIDLAPFEYDEAYTRLHRTHRLDAGRVVRFMIREDPAGALSVELEGQRLDAEEETEIRRAVRRIFGLDLDLSAFYDLLRGDDRYSWVEEYGAGRLLRAPTVWEDLVKTLLTTNTTWAMTRAMVRRLTALGDLLGGFRTFPTPGQVTAFSLEEIDARVRAGYRSGYLHELARKIVDGEIDVESWHSKDLTADELYGRIKSLSGFGPYAAGAVLKLLGKFDRLALDSAARSMFAREFAGGERALDSTISAHYEPFGEWRGLVMWMDLMGGYMREHS